MKKIISIFLSLLMVFASTTVITYADTLNDDIYKTTYTVNYAEYDSFSPDNEIVVGKENYILKSFRIIDKNTEVFEVINNDLENKEYTAPDNAVNPNNQQQNGKLLYTTITQYKKSDRNQLVTQNVDYTALPINDTAPSIFKTEYVDPEANQVIEVELKLTDAKKSNSYWINSDGLNGSVTGYDALYYTLNNSDIQIPKSENQPTYIGYENSILKSLNLNEADYRITDSSWSGDTYYNAEGILCRNCIYDAQMKVCDVTATYSANIDLPDVVTYTATSIYENEDANQYIIEAEYEKVQDKISPTVIIVSTAAGLLILAALIAIILLYLSKKKKSEDKK